MPDLLFVSLPGAWVISHVSGLPEDLINRLQNMTRVLACHRSGEPKDFKDFFEVEGDNNFKSEEL